MRQPFFTIYNIFLIALFPVFLPVFLHKTLKYFPSILMLYKIFRTVFSCHIIMPYQMIHIQMVIIHQLRHQIHTVIIGCIIKITRIIRMAHLNRDADFVQIIGAVCNLITGNTLDNLSLQTNYKLGTGKGLLRVLQFSK